MLQYQRHMGPGSDGEDGWPSFKSCVEEDNLKDEENHENEDNLKNEDDVNEDNLKSEDLKLFFWGRLRF